MFEVEVAPFWWAVILAVCVTLWKWLPLLRRQFRLVLLSSSNFRLIPVLHLHIYSQPLTEFSRRGWDLKQERTLHFQAQALTTGRLEDDRVAFNANARIIGTNHNLICAS